MNRTLLLLALFVSGCSLNPALTHGPSPVAQHYAQQNAATGNGADLGWREMFKDPQLQQAIALALSNNRDLRIAMLNVDTVQAQYRIQRAARLPGVEMNGSWTRQNSGSNAASGTGGITDQTTAGVNLSAFEIDLFGRVKSLSTAAYARYLATEAGSRAARISLIASVARAWYNQMQTAEQLALSRQTLQDWQHSLVLARQLQAANQNSAIDVAQAEGQVATAEADVQANERAYLQAGNALRLLVGTRETLPVPQSTLMKSDIETELPAGIPSDLLTRRPDIIQAELNLQAANADIGAARAAFFPRISLTASFGQASPQLSQLFDSGSQTWQFLPQVSIPLFQGGRLQAELDVAKLKKSTAVADYDKAIQVAFREVSDGLAGNATYRKQMSAQQRVVESAERRLHLSMQRYQAGLDNRLELLDAQRQLYSAQQTLLTLRQNEIDNAITLYKALGGGIKE
ncbi:efflux transporter outer membrane subunit [Candidatus Pantoea multigeneris]|uniref:Efflux transporter outer membrane subunit n=1 Tax=Candidatus Pantoea multigeneris TaxID=2608357 RepID=A0ABX0R8I2_9GAMM|nr:efflux transporter outer membrane subunit [Pantoea multigeneris]NIF21682.1 efflux transporter outer membrane subunit [Pantoea multigeneris]